MFVTKQRLFLGAVLAAQIILAGCFRFEAVHQMNYYGEQDYGVYRFALERAAHDLDPGIIDGVEDHFDSFSDPRFYFDGNYAVLEDLTANAQMEHIYDQFDCRRSGVGTLVDCSFRIFGDELDFPAWVVDWEVILLPGMEVLTSNHHSTGRTDDGWTTLQWYFDGNRTDRFDISFTLRVPAY